MTIAGVLRHKVSLERQTTDVDDYGQRIENWTVIAQRRASIEPLNGREYFDRAGEMAEVTTRIRLRYDASLADLRPADRVTYRGQIYDIASVIRPQEHAEDLVLMTVRNYD